MSCEAIRVKSISCQNDTIRFKNKDDILTALIHPDYPACDKTNQTAFIPAGEIHNEFTEAVEENRWTELTGLPEKSHRLIQATLETETETVDEVAKEIHAGYAAGI